VQWLCQQPTRIVVIIVHNEHVDDLKTHDDYNYAMNALTTNKNYNFFNVQWTRWWPISTWWLQLHDEHVNNQR
jgi:hypothetical protein